MLRHTFVTTMLDAGVDLRDVQIAARHADPRTTMRYDRARKNLRPPPELHPRGVYGVRHLTASAEKRVMPQLLGPNHDGGSEIGAPSAHGAAPCPASRTLIWTALGMSERGRHRFNNMRRAPAVLARGARRTSALHLRRSGCRDAACAVGPEAH
jgi:hypothetical protein